MSDASPLPVAETATATLAIEPEPSAQEQAAWPAFKRPSYGEMAAIMRLHAEGHSTRRIEQLTSIPHYTVWRVIEKFRSTADEARMSLQAGAADAVTEWRERAIPKAAARGDHRPAMDLLKAAKVIDDNPTVQQMIVLGGLQPAGATNAMQDPWRGAAETKPLILNPGAKQSLSPKSPSEPQLEAKVPGMQSDGPE
jgi:hypothetical protein